MKFLQSSSIQPLARAALVALLAIATVACSLGTLGPPPPRPSRPGPLPRASLLAVGDTGEPAHLMGLLHPARRIGAAMADEDLFRPVQALVLLGDNFYPHGLGSDRMLAQIRESVAAPFCHFLDPESPRADELAPDCGLESRRHHPIPILAVLGNHDYGSSGSPGREHTGIREWIPNWRLSTRLAVTRELEGGLSLILVDSSALMHGADPRAVVEELRSSRGPWRILALHHPVFIPQDARSVPKDGVPALGEPRDRNQRRREELRRWIAEARVPVQLVLSGHEHNLQLLPIPAPMRGLQVIVGSGSRLEPVAQPLDSEVSFARAWPGFARVDLVESSAGERLEILLFRVRVRSWPGRGRAQMVARWAVSLEGRITPLFPLDP